MSLCFIGFIIVLFISWQIKGTKIYLFDYIYRARFITLLGHNELLSCVFAFVMNMFILHHSDCKKKVSFYNPFLLNRHKTRCTQIHNERPRHFNDNLHSKGCGLNNVFCQR